MFLSVNEISNRDGLMHKLDIGELIKSFGPLGVISKQSITGAVPEDWRSRFGVVDLDAMYGAGFQAPEAAAFSVAYLLPDGELPAANGLVEGRFIQTEFNQSFEVVGYSFARDTRYDFSALRLVDMVDGSYTSSPYGDAELVIAGMQSARIISSSGSDVVFGSSFSDTIATGLGDDRVFGGGGSDLLDGGAGWDTADYWLSMLSLTADLQMSQFNTGDAHGDVFRSIENLQGTRFNDDLRGDAQANQIWGGTGNDTLSG
ncbi:MAG: hypothetical protein AAFY91_14210, partial [Bacteroidota bacterium]